MFRPKLKPGPKSGYKTKLEFTSVLDTILELSFRIVL